MAGIATTPRADTSIMIAEISAETELSEKLIRERAGSVLRSMLHNYSDLSVMTIDKFTHSVIRAFAADLGLSPDFDIEINETLLHQYVVEALFEKIGTDKELTKYTLAFASKEIEDEKNANLTNKIESIIRVLSFDEYAMSKAHIPHLSLQEINGLNNRLRARISDIETQIKEPAMKALDIVERNGLSADDFWYTKTGPYGFFLKSSTLSFGPSFPGSRMTQGIERESWQGKTKNSRVDELKAELYPLAHDILQNLPLIRERKLLMAMTKQLYEFGFYAELLQLLKEVKLDQNVQTLSDFNRIISERLDTENAHFLFERLGNRYDHILIDEFQDTSTVQWKNLFPLIENGLASGKESLVVGDAKQSIYRFRGGDSNQFTDLPKAPFDHANTLANAFQEDILTSNYRSSKQIVEFNNRFFREASALELFDGFNKPYEHAAQQVRREDHGEVKWRFIDLEKEALVNELCLGVRSQVLEKGVPQGDICCLFRKNSDASMAAQILLEMGIDVISSESLLLEKNPKISFIVTTLQCLASPNDPFLVQKWLAHYSTLFALKDHHKKAIELKKSKTSFFSLIKQLNHRLVILNGSNAFYATVSICDSFGLKKDDHFIKRFLDLCLEFESSSAYLKESFLEYWMSQKEKLSIELPEGPNAVQIMTIHKSKGLEFPHVFLFLPSFKPMLTKSNMWVKPDGELGLTDFLMSTSQLKGTPMEDIYTEENARTQVDELNTLYVAFTRPRNSLYVFSQKQPTSGPFSLVRSWEEFDDATNTLLLT